MLALMQVPEGTRVSAFLRQARPTGHAVALILVVALSGAVLWWLKPQDVSAVKVGADVIAVFPFTTSGPGVSYLAEGMVDLLGINLNEVPGVRTTSARTGLRHWRERAASGDVDLAGAIEVGRRVGARSVLTGSVLATGSELRLSAELHGVDGGRLASAGVDGTPSDVLGLVDRLSLALLEDVWRSREPLPRFQISVITTDALGAMREYLRGEAHFRRGQWGPAIAAYERAVAADTAFAIAYHRLAQAYGWSENVFSESTAFSVDAAHRFSDRLPARQRRLVEARWLGDQDLMSPAPNDSLRAYLERYPDDVEAWHILADRGFHQQQVYGWGSERLLDPVERLLALDSTLAPALIHPIQLGLRYGDRDVFDEKLTAACRH